MGLGRFGGRLRGAQAVSSWLRGGGTGIVRIQRDIITIAAGATSNTATLPVAVDVSRSVIRFLGYTPNGAATTPDITQCRVALTNGTTVTAFVNSTGAAGRVVSFEVIEYAPGVIKRVQRGTITTTASTNGTDTITTVDVSKSTLDYLGFTTDFTGGTDVGFCGTRIVLTNGTTVTAVGVGSLNRTVGYQAVEWN